MSVTQSSPCTVRVGTQLPVAVSRLVQGLVAVRPASCAVSASLRAALHRHSDSPVVVNVPFRFSRAHRRGFGVGADTLRYGHTSTQPVRRPHRSSEVGS